MSAHHTDIAYVDDARRIARDLDAIDPIAGVIAGVRAWAINEGDSLELKLPPECVDALIMDPPAGIGFMGKEWDGAKGGMEQWIAWAARLFKVAFDALKPGAHGAVWALPRTCDWTMQALRRAGFEVRDVMLHVFASGFPKSLDVGKAIDSSAGATRERIRPVPVPRRQHDGTRWAGWGTALKPAHECWIIVRKPLRGTVAANVLARGCGGINVDAGRVGSDVAGWTGAGRGDGSCDESACGLRAGDARPVEGRWPSNIVFSHASWDESACMACGLTMPFSASFCPRCGSGVEVRRAGCRCAGIKNVRGAARTGPNGGTAQKGFGGLGGEAPGAVLAGNYTDADGNEIVAAWECLATCDRCGQSALVSSGGDAGWCAGCGALRRWACPVARLDEQSGERASGSFDGTRSGLGYGSGSVGNQGSAYEANAGGASRFFHCFPPDPAEPFWFSAKPSTAEREAGLEGLPRKTAGELTDREDGSAGTWKPRAKSAPKQAATTALAQPSLFGDGT